MKRYSLLAGISTATMAMLCSQALAQEAAGQLVAVEPQEEAEEEVQARPKLSEITLGITTYESVRALDQYANPMEGFGLHSLRLLWFIVRGMANQDNLADLYTVVNDGKTTIHANRLQYGRQVLDWRQVSPSGRDEVNLTVDQAISENVSGFLTYHSGKRGTNYAAPRGADQTHTQRFGGGIGANVLGGNLGIAFSDRRTYNGAGVQPTTVQRGVNADYSRDITQNLSIGGAASLSHIEQTGQPDGDINAYKFYGYLDMGPKTGMQFQFARQDNDLETIMNAYVRKRLQSNVRVIHRLPGWVLQMAYNRKESERVRANHEFVDVPKSDGYDVRLSGKLAGARLKLRGSWEQISNDAVMNSNDPRRLYWGDRATVQAKLEGGTDKLSAYGSYTYRLNQNHDRGLQIGWHNIAVGGSYVFSPDLFGYAELSFDDFQVEGEDGVDHDLDFYFPNARSLSIGADWSESPELSAGAGLNFYESGNVRGTQLTFRVRRRLSEDNDLELIVAPWSRNDREYDMTSYHSTFLSARYTTRF
jgi:hypothetical protein